MDANDLGEKIVKTIKTIYDPEIPGKIIAQLAMNPAKKIKVIFSFKLSISDKLVSK